MWISLEDARYSQRLPFRPLIERGGRLQKIGNSRARRNPESHHGREHEAHSLSTYDYALLPNRIHEETDVSGRGLSDIVRRVSQPHHTQSERAVVMLVEDGEGNGCVAYGKDRAAFSRQ